MRKAILLVLLLAISLNAGELWHVRSLSGKVGGLTLGMNEEQRFSDVRWYHHFETSVTKQLGIVKLDCRLRQIHGKFEDTWYSFNVIVGNRLSNRFRFQYAGIEKYRMYRNKIKFDWNGLYLADEVFIVFKNCDFVRNRFYVGKAQKVGKWKFDVFYLFQWNKGKANTNVMGINVGVGL